MSIFNELLPKINEISNAYVKNFNDDLKAVFQCFDKFEEEFQNGRGKAREKALKDKNALTTLQSIHEDDDEIKAPETVPKRKSSLKSTKINDEPASRSSSDSNGERRGSKKRNKNEVDGMSSPEQDKRQKRNASVKAQTIISKQVNVNLTAKLRRDDSADKSQRGRGGRRKDDDKENAEPEPVLQIKLEKVSIPPEPMDMESLPLNVEVKQENRDDMAMPPPVAPVPKPRKALAKDKPDESVEEEPTRGRRTTRTRKQTETMPPPPVPSSRSTRASSRATKQLDNEETLPPPEPRPKRTRAKKKVSESSNTDAEKETATPRENGMASPADKPRPKRTRRGQKAAEKHETPKPEEPKPTEVSPKEERISQPEIQSPVLQTLKTKEKPETKETRTTETLDGPLDETRVICGQKLDATVTISDMDRTVVLPNGVYNHAPVTPKNVQNMNETVVLEGRTRSADLPMDATIVIHKDPKATNVTDDNSLLTDDSDSQPAGATPPRPPPKPQPTSAVKEKVQQFEEMASRVTRTKTRAMAKKEEPTDNQTPPDKILKPVLSAETLNKMNSMIFNGKAPQISTSASKPRVNVAPVKSVPASASKVSGVRAKDVDSSQREKEDARAKKEALLEAKREMQKRKREEKMAAAAAAREAAERERRAALQAAARGRLEKQAHADLGKLDRLREAERKKQELARKVAETEERRRADELARQQRLADEQRKADAARRKQLEEAEAMKKEAAIMAKEIEKRQKEYIEKQKMKQRLDGDKISTPLKTAGTPGRYPAMEPVYMCDGFQYLNSDEDEEPVERPVPTWSTSKARRAQLYVQTRVNSSHIDCLFSVQEYMPDLRQIFPAIDRARLKRTSSAVWRTPPHRLPALTE